MVRSRTIDTVPLPVVAWGLAVALFVFGDMATTTVGVYVVDGIVEGHPVSAEALAVGGVAIMAAAKAIVVGVVYVGTRYVVVPRFRAIPPVALALFGAAIVGWNIAVIAYVMV